MPKTLGLRCLLLLAAAAAAPAADARTWTNDQGQTLEADFVRLSGRTAILRDGDGETVRAPIDRLSEADQEWITAYRRLARPREWGSDPDTQRRGRFQVLTAEGVQVKQGSELVEVPFAELSEEGWANIEAIYAHLEQELPLEFTAARPKPPEVLTPPEGVPPRQWIDARGRKIEAVYGGTDGAEVLLWRNEKRFGFPIAKLSEADRTWIAQQGVGKLTSDLASGFAAAGELFAAAVASQGGHAPHFIPMPGPPTRQPRRSERAAPAPPEAPPAPNFEGYPDPNDRDKDDRREALAAQGYPVPDRPAQAPTAGEQAAEAENGE